MSDVAKGRQSVESLLQSVESLLQSVKFLLQSVKFLLLEGTLLPGPFSSAECDDGNCNVRSTQ